LKNITQRERYSKGARHTLATTTDFAFPVLHSNESENVMRLSLR
jgi:hypothetical protein